MKILPVCIYLRYLDCLQFTKHITSTAGIIVVRALCFVALTVISISGTQLNSLGVQ